MNSGAEDLGTIPVQSEMCGRNMTSENMLLRRLVSCYLGTVISEWWEALSRLESGYERRRLSEHAAAAPWTQEKAKSTSRTWHVYRKVRVQRNAKDRKRRSYRRGDRGV